MRKHKFFLAALFLFTLNSCSHSYYATRSLKEHLVNSIRLYVDTTLMIQESSHEIGLLITTQHNDTLETKGLLKGKLPWKNLIVKAEGATFSNGKLTVLQTDSTDYIPYVPISFSSKFEPEKLFFDTIPLNYETAINIFPTKNFNSFPGSKVDIGMSITYNNAEQKLYTSIDKIKHFSDYYEVLLRASSYNKSQFVINSDPLYIPEHISGVMIQSKFNHDIYSIFEVNVDYRNQYKYYANGGSGLSGFSGSSGSSGSSGQSGTNGRNGQFGDFGYNGNDLDVYLDAYHDSILGKTMVKAYIGNINTKQIKRFLIDPDGGNLHISATGGNGGYGGRGGDGGSGGEGKNGEIYTETIYEIHITKDTAGNEIQTKVPKTITKQKPGQNGGNGGDGGFGGNGGNGGNGGYVIVYSTPNAQRFLNLVTIDVSGGYGGSGGSGGAGGTGGKGKPNGHNGRSGRNAPDGMWGYSGASGRIEHQTVNEIPWE